MLDSLVVEGLSEERLEGVAFPGVGVSLSFECDTPSRPRGMLGREDDGRRGAGWEVSGVIVAGIPSVDADGVLR